MAVDTHTTAFDNWTDDQESASVTIWDEFTTTPRAGYIVSGSSFVFWLWRVGPPVILVFGTFGNVMTIVVLRRMSARQSAVPMSVYFIALAVSDLIVLYNRLVYSWILHNFYVNLMDLNIVFCKLIYFVDYLCAMTSSWILVAMATHRAFSVVRPHRANLICSSRKSCVVVLVIFVLSVLYNTHLLFDFAIMPQNGTEGKCAVVDEVAKYIEYSVYVYVDMVFGSLAPFSVLLACNVLLVWKVTQSVTTVRRMAMASSTHVTSRQRNISSLTVTLIVTSAVYIVLTVPIYVVFAFNGEKMVDLFAATDTDDTMELVYAICNQLWYVNSAINFYLYVLSGRKFREEFKRCFRRKEDT